MQVLWATQQERPPQQSPLYFLYRAQHKEVTDFGCVWDVDNLKNLRILCGWREGLRATLLAAERVTLLRGRRDGLDVRVSSDDLDGGFAELQARLTERPSFFRGSAAVVDFGTRLPASEDISRLRGILEEAGVVVDAGCALDRRGGTPDG